MPVHNFAPLKGRIETITVASEALAGNLLGDPAEREVAVYLPPGYDEETADYPLLVDLVGFTGSGLKHIAWRSFGETVPQRIERLVEEGAMGKVICAFPDCFTSLGGNQYVDSAAMGMWERFLCEDMVNALEDRFRVRRGRDHRALFGKSSGGYGSIVHAMKHADTWAAAACHSGDMAFDLAYRHDFAATCTHLAKFGGIEGFLHHIEQARAIGGREMHTLMVLAMAATYDPDPGAYKGIRLPVDLHTCTLNEERWTAWLDHDPLVLADRPDSLSNLRSLRGLLIDCGSRDQYHLHFGARVLHRKLRDAGVGHRYEEFEDDHSGIDYRMDVSLPFLYHALVGG